MNDSTFTHHTTTVNSIRLHYVIGGQGDPILLWHGFLGTSYSWHKLMPILAKHYTVIAPDMRGYGDSDKPASGYDAGTLMEDFRSLIHQLGFAKIFIVAHDMGAPPALLYAGQYPDEVRGLAYLEDPVILEEYIQTFLRFGPETMQEGGMWWWVFSLAPKIPEILISGHEREFLTWFYDRYLYDRHSINDETVNEYLRTFATPDGIRGAIGVYRAIFATMKQTAAYTQEKINTPILGLGGDRSLGEYTKQMLKSVATDVRGGVIEQCGHFIPEEQPDVLAKHLLEFFTEIAKNPPGF
jgi:pimeloyl-ACP methyl ester carboxylesterase